MKHQDKVADALAARQAKFDPGRQGEGLLCHKPGSQNRKKGYKRKAAKGRR